MDWKDRIVTNPEICHDHEPAWQGVKERFAVFG